MNNLQIINENSMIRETIGYNAIKDIELQDLLQIIEFLKIVFNYKKMKKIDKN